MTKEKIVEYVMHTPYNTNKAVLESLLDDLRRDHYDGNDVNFYDYDGTIVEAYTKEEFLQLSTMPANPSHAGLTAQGWNWSLADAKTYVTTYGKLDIGQMYVTASGDTEIDVMIPTERRDPYLAFAVDGTATIDWGDNSATDTLTGTSLTTQQRKQHTYSASGNYTIKITVSSGNAAFYSDGTISNCKQILQCASQRNTYDNIVYANMIQSIRLGDNFNIGDRGIYFCKSLQYITIPDSITSIGYRAFSTCSSLKTIIIPNGISTLSNDSPFGDCDALEHIILPNGITNISSGMANSCLSLRSITIPDSVINIEYEAFLGCTALRGVTIPNSVTNIEEAAFMQCLALKDFKLPNNIINIKTAAFQSCPLIEITHIPNSVTNIGTTAFKNCNSLQDVTLPSGITSIGNNTFEGCYRLRNIVIPNGVTSIGNSAFNGCFVLTTITIPSGVTSIGTQAFSDCRGMKEYHFLPTTPPTITNTNVFTSIPSDCTIYVPQASVNAYKTANYWSTYASQIVGE